MSEDFIELKSTEGQSVFVRREAVSAFEVVPASNRVEGHIKIFIGGFKFLIQIDKENLLKQLQSSVKR